VGGGADKHRLAVLVTVWEREIDCDGGAQVDGDRDRGARVADGAGVVGGGIGVGGQVNGGIGYGIRTVPGCILRCTQVTAANWLGLG
jgi:hypothetical protein